MFFSARAYGFPGQYIVLMKQTNIREEAQKVYSLPAQELRQQGWQFSFSANSNSPVSQSPIINVIVNLLFSFAISLVGVLFVSTIWKTEKNSPPA
jgi:hypothetical protein